MSGFMRIQPTADQVSIVLLGAFNPKIFHPAWLAKNELISEDAASDADVEIVHSDITRFKAGYIKYEVMQTRFIVRCDAAHRELVKDLTLSVFIDHLPHTPVWQFGINRAISFSCGTEETRDKLGNMLAPKKPWGVWGEEISQPAGRSHGGMVRLIMREIPRQDGLNGHIQADIRPLETDLADVLVDVNNHITISDPEKTIGCTDAMDLLNDQWQNAMTKSEHIVDYLMASVQELK